jgi:hypothetical protein
MKKLILIAVTFLLIGCSATEEIREKSILVLGNSIVYHSKAEYLGWYGDWGMAASSPDKDFAHILKANIPNYNFKIKNVAQWEQSFSTDFYGGTEHYDYIFVKLSENVVDTERYREELPKLLRSYMDKNTKVFLISSVWFSPEKDLITKETAELLNQTYVDISEMQIDNTNYAWNEYENGAVGCHPGNLGMEFIAKKCLKNLHN